MKITACTLCFSNSPFTVWSPTFEPKISFNFTDNFSDFSTMSFIWSRNSTIASFSCCWGPLKRSSSFSTSKLISIFRFFSLRFSTNFSFFSKIRRSLGTFCILIFVLVFRISLRYISSNLAFTFSWLLFTSVFKQTILKEWVSPLIFIREGSNPKDPWATTASQKSLFTGTSHFANLSTKFCTSSKQSDFHESPPLSPWYSIAAVFSLGFQVITPFFLAKELLSWSWNAVLVMYSITSGSTAMSSVFDLVLLAISTVSFISPLFSSLSPSLMSCNS